MNKGTVKKIEKIKIKDTPISITLIQEIKIIALINKSRLIIIKKEGEIFIPIAIKSKTKEAIKSSNPSILTIIKI